MPSSFPCGPVIRECSWKKTQIEKIYICSKFTREHSCRSAISIKLQSNLGVSQTAFKLRYANHKKTFNNMKYQTDAGLSNEYWNFIANKTSKVSREKIFRWWVRKHENISTKKFAFLIVTLWTVEFSMKCPISQENYFFPKNGQSGPKMP